MKLNNFYDKGFSSTTQKFKYITGFEFQEPSRQFTNLCQHLFHRPKLIGQKKTDRHLTDLTPTFLVENSTRYLFMEPYESNTFHNSLNLISNMIRQK